MSSVRVQEPTPTITSFALHTMGPSLQRYLDIKVHHLVPFQPWTEIEVVGHHIRSAPAIIYNGEKTDKAFNYQRPTATILGEGKLRINCFPGRDYVKHYANIVATHLAIEGKDPGIVKIKLPQENAGYEEFMNSNLRGLAGENTNLVLVGSIPREILRSTEPWNDEEDADELFSWQTVTKTNGFTVTILKCRASFWGDLAGDLVRCLREICGVSLQRVIYVGKLGALAREHTPNRTLATGSKSFVNGEFVEWENPIGEEILGEVARGVHYTSASVLDEDHAWFEKVRREFCWVDPEIGHMAVAARERGVRFGFLHMVSNNLAGGFEFDLANERERVVVDDRVLMNKWIEKILNDFVEDLDEKFGGMPKTCGC
ncbi:hypothetical protein BOTNAR_0004g00140 [Botryotinia narcissicola]|uniref:Nucleoside phosphorylase domain-containing protein n=1 Tax=Botryotinia narcissicola TaxID=278944 RepID=A0A4Z1J8J6_9HELO|nr:hypothetical protein BOTNAR_0004g00140 [Botryotinia narcissicola]